MKTLDFNLKRAYQLTLRHILYSKGTLLIGTLAFAGFLLAVAMLTIMSPSLFHNYQLLVQKMSLPIIILVGCIISSTSFKEIHTFNKGNFYLTIPVSNLERLASVWFFSSVIYLVWTIAVLLIVNTIIGLMGNLMANISFETVNLFSDEAFQFYKLYFVIQTVFLFGSAYFKKNQFLKVFLSFFGLFLFLALVTNLVAKIFFGDFSPYYFTQVAPELEQYAETFKVVLKTAFWIFTAPFFLLLTFISLKEKQI